MAYCAQMTQFTSIMSGWPRRLAFGELDCQTYRGDYILTNGIREVLAVLSAKYYEAVARLEHKVPAGHVHWYVPTFRKGVDMGAALVEIPKAIGLTVIDLIESDFSPERASSKPAESRKASESRTPKPSHWLEVSPEPGWRLIQVGLSLFPLVFWLLVIDASIYCAISTIKSRTEYLEGKKRWEAISRRWENEGHLLGREDLNHDNRR